MIEDVGEDEDSPPTPAESLYGGWRAACEDGKAVSFEEFVGGHPGLAAELTRLHEREARLESIIGSNFRDQSTPASPRLLFGDAAPGSEILERLGPSSAKYRLEDEIGRGGMGAVYRAEDRLLKRFVAYKFTADPRRSRVRLRQFLREMELAGSLNHPGIASVHDAGIDESGRAYFTMPLVRGRNLSEVIRLVREQEGSSKAQWSVLRVVGILAQVAETMAYVHSRGVIHRDLKPSNIRVGDFGEVYVMDWGLAKRIAEDPEWPEQSEPQLIQSASIPGFGTAPYASPEQWIGGASVGPATDVHAIGVMLYELLAGRLPFVEHAEDLPTTEEFTRRMKRGRPASIHALARRHPAELASVCAKAMESDPSKRYADCAALARDLRACLEDRVVAAHETGTWAETRKWVRRNRPLALAIAGIIVVLAVGIVTVRQMGKRSAIRNEELASLSMQRSLDELKEEADELWPADSTMVARLEDWQRRARDLVYGAGNAASLDIQRRRLERLRERALPGEVDKDDAESEEIERLRGEQEWYGRMLGERPWPSESEVKADIAERIAADIATLGEFEPAASRVDRAWELVDPCATRIRFGRERVGLALLQAERTEHGVHDSDFLMKLTWAQLRAGLFDAALQTREELRSKDDARRTAPQAAEHARNLDMLDRAIARWRGDAELAQRREELMAIDARLTALEAQQALLARRDYEAVEDRWWERQLAQLVGDLNSFGSAALGGLMADGVSDESGWGVARRLREARQLRERTVTGATARERWTAAIESIGKSAAYRDCAWPGGALAPQEGLLPLGPDRDSGLWEFAVVQSGEIPVRDAADALVMEEESAIVLVLVPGGTFTMGAQSVDLDGPNFDPSAEDDEGPPHRVTLSPYFISKYEMTQSQWMRASGRNPSDAQPPSIDATSLLHPVEQISWRDADSVVRRFGLTLPTEAQWEFACRGGTSTPWWTGSGRASLALKVNIADRAAARGKLTWPQIKDWPEYDDGYALHAPVSAFAPNPFGLHNVHGNVWEWCADEYAEFEVGDALDPCKLGKPQSQRVFRGGSFGNNAKACRATQRGGAWADQYTLFIGLRPARPVRSGA